MCTSGIFVKTQMVVVSWTYIWVLYANMLSYTSFVILYRLKHKARGIGKQIANQSWYVNMGWAAF
ncbi:rCG44301, partial [Rattus norvegicus]